MSRTLILDLDGSVKPMPGAETLPLRGWEEAIRFGCRQAQLDALEREIESSLAPHPAVTFMGSGDFHHLSYLLIRRLKSLGTGMQVVVFDNHPDNMRYPFGIHCGSWVRHVSKLPFVKRVLVAGITSTDVEAGRLWENYLSPLYAGKVAYFCVNRNLSGLRRIGVRQCRSFSSTGDMMTALAGELAAVPDPVYLSIDKDVLAADEVRTNWDQGVMRVDELFGAIRSLEGRIVAGDVVGDVSAYRYRSGFKRFLSGLDSQPAIPADELARWQAEHQPVNLELMSLLSP